MSSEVLNSYARYIITESCQLKVEDNPESKNVGKVKTLTGRDVTKEIGTAFELDKRFNLISVDSTGDLDEYIRYYCFFLQQVEALLSMESPSGNFVNQLDLGFVPVFVPPTYLYSTLSQPFREAIEQTKIKIYEKPSMRLDGSGINSESRDIWCSRLELAKLFGKHPCSFKMGDYLEMILPYISI